MQKPPIIQTDPIPGPDFDPMDRIVQDMQNIESFLARLAMDHKDLTYLNTHLSSILGLRRAISEQIDKLADDPYNYPPTRIQTLHAENERLYTYLEGVVGSMNPWNGSEFKKTMKATEETLLKFDRDLTP